MHESALETEFKARARLTSGAAAARLLASGHPIAYRERDTPSGHVVRRHPDGRVELVEVDLDASAVAGTR